MNQKPGLPDADAVDRAPQESVAKAILRVEELHKEYRAGAQVVRALNGVSFSVPAGRLVAIMGASGSGKSTLLHLCGGLDLPSRGTVEVDGHELSKMSDRKRTLFRRRKLGVIFQAYNLLPSLTARENIALPFLVDGVSGHDARKKTDELIELVHLGHRASHRPQAMSGGEQQRVAIARALLNDPALILADEPTGNLDSANAVEIWVLLRRLSHELGKTVLMVSHEAAGAAYADEVLVLKDGVEVGRIQPKDEHDAALVANRYQELAG